MQVLSQLSYSPTNYARRERLPAEWPFALGRQSVLLVVFRSTVWRL